MTPRSLRFEARSWLFAMLMSLLYGAGNIQHGLADDFIIAPHLSIGPTGTIYPFLIKELGLSSTNIPTMRYQQVYMSSLFTNASAGSIYVTTLTFYGDSVDPPSNGWTVPSMQINLSTTTNTADNLSSVFAENVGPDDTIVLDRASYALLQVIRFSRPFRYSPPLGNLLLDVRIFDGSDSPFPVSNPFPKMQALNSPSDEVSRLWSTNVMAAAATCSDTAGLKTVIELSPIPSLRAYTSYFGTTTNWVAIEWPTQPTTFVLQRSTSVAANAQWKTVSNAGVFSNATYQRYYFPADSAGAAAFYRLIWPSGLALTRSSGEPKTPASKIDESTR
jgi:hypothetical protein